MRTVYAVFFLYAPILALAQNARHMSDAWVDSQGNPFTVSPRGVSITIASPGWTFETGGKTYRGNLLLTGRRSGVDITAVQNAPDGVWSFKGRVAANGSILGSMQLPGSQPFEFILRRREIANDSPLLETPERIIVRLSKQSTSDGRWIPLFVSAAKRDGTMVVPPRAISVTLNAQGGTAIPDRVKLTPQVPLAAAGIRVTPGTISLKAESSGFTPVAITAWGCADTPVTAIQISSQRSDGLANGRDVLPVILKFVDANGSPSHNQGRAKSVAWAVNGAIRKSLPGRAGLETDIAIASDECISQQEFTSERPGKATAIASFASWREEVSFRFHAPLTAIAILMALAGGLLGGAVSATTRHKAALQWKAKRWAVWMLSSLTGALALFLAWHYGLVNQWSAVPSGNGFAFLAGLVGGFGGSRVLASLVDTVVPERKPDIASAPGAA